MVERVYKCGVGNNYLQSPGAFRKTTVATGEADKTLVMRIDVLTWGEKRLE